MTTEAASQVPVRCPAASWRWIHLALVIFVMFRYQPPSVGTDEPHGFSAHRARETMGRVLEDLGPHPTGSPENETVKSRILEELGALGIEGQVQRTFVTGPYGSADTVANVLARLPGREDLEPVLVLAHYDSVDAGPGASDDGIGVACVLEIARVLKESPARRPVILLFTDGEEAGLLGATAFVEQHPWAKGLFGVINLDGRGSGGLSMLLETGAAEGPWIREYTKGAWRPLVTSVTDVLYEHIPAETDFSVFKEHGYAGFNLAFVGDIFHYHTAHDSLGNVSLGSIRHMGVNALGMIDRLATMQAPPAPGEATAHFDLLGYTVIRIPLSWMLPLASFAFLLHLLTLLRLGRTRRITMRSWLAGLGLAAIAFLGALVAGLVMQAIFTFTGAIPSLWVASPLLPTIALLLTGGATVATVHRIGSYYHGAWAMWSAHRGWGCLLALVTSLTVPAVAYLFVIPALIAAVLSLIAGRRPDATGPDCIQRLPTVVTAVLWLPLGWYGYLSLGFGLGALPAAMAFIVWGGVSATLASPSPAPHRGTWLQVVFFSLLASATDPFDARRPQPVMLINIQDLQENRAHWMASALFGPLPEVVVEEGRFSTEPKILYPWAGPLGWTYVAAAKQLPPEPPRLEVKHVDEKDGQRVVTAQLLPSREATSCGFLVPPGAKLEALEVGGRPMPAIPEKMVRLMNGWQRFSVGRLPDSGIALKFTFARETPVEVSVYSLRPGVPEADDPLVRERLPEVTTLQSRDSTAFVIRATL